MAKRDPLLDHLFVYIGDKAFTMAQLGPAANMGFAEGFQYIIDQGMLGEDLKGKDWFEVIKPSGFRLEGIPKEEETFLFTLHKKWQDAELECMKLDLEGKLTPEHVDAMMKLKKDYDAAKKLATP